MGPTLSIRAMVIRGELAGVRLGLSRAQVRARLGEPDDWSVVGGRHRARRDDVDRSPVWRYGNFEVHFDGDQSVRFFTDYVGEPYAGEGRGLDRWIFDGESSLDFSSIVGRLLDENAEFDVRRDTLRRRVVCVAGGGRLHFDSSETGAECCVAISVELPGREDLESMPGG
jgi:hypothetical protein